MSANGKWCLVTAPGKKKVYVYAPNERGEIHTQSLQGDGSTTAFVQIVNLKVLEVLNKYMLDKQALI